MDFLYILQLVLGFIGIIILALSYTYIDKLEKTGCACSEHPYRKFVKNYCIFAIVFLAIMILIPPSALKSLTGVPAFAFNAVKILFAIATIIFLVMALIYTRYLMKEKCKCSEDMRREVLYVWAIVELILVAALVVLPFLVFAIAGSTVIAKSAMKEGNKYADTVIEASVNPLKSAKKVPASLKKNLKLRK
jgi:hypothetical protein